MSGSFLATKDCPAFQSFRKATNPGGIKIVPGHSYPLLAKNAPQPSHYRVRIEGAEPAERWVSVDCGSYNDQAASEDLQNSGASSGPSNGRPAEAVLSLGWEPGFCEGHAGKAECANQTLDHFDATNFTLHGLWPQPRRREYCNVSQALIDTDRKRDWQALPEVDLDAATRAHLVIAMPGTQSFLDRHEWIRHGTCYGRGDPQAYFHEALSLLDEERMRKETSSLSTPIRPSQCELQALARVRSRQCPLFKFQLGHGADFRRLSWRGPARCPEWILTRMRHNVGEVVKAALV